MTNHGHSINKQVDTISTNTLQEEQVPESMLGLGRFDAMQHAIKNPSKETLTPQTVIQLQRTIGNQAVLRMLAGSKSNGNLQSIDEGLSQRKNLIIQRALDGNAGNDNRQEFQYGLVRGGYTAENNKADAHIDADPDGHLQPANMLLAIQDINQAMVSRRDAGGPLGEIELHPQGAVALKTVAELLGGALGGFVGKLKALALQTYRKKFKQVTKHKQSSELDPVIVPEHMAFLKALIGVGGITMATQVLGDPITEAEFDQNMLDNTPEGIARMGQYEDALNADKTVTLRVTVTQDNLPAIIELLS